MNRLRTAGAVPSSVSDARLKSFLESLRDRSEGYEQEIAALEAAITPEDWHFVGSVGEPQFENSWVNYEWTNTDAGFYKVGDIVHLGGLVKSGTIPGAIFTLPENYRPQGTLHFPVSSNASFGVVRIFSSGTVDVLAGSNVWLSLEGISFRL